MDVRASGLHSAAISALVQRIEGYSKVSDILAAPTADLTADKIKTAIQALDADLPSPLKATLFDLARVLSGALPTDDVAVPPSRLKLYVPEF